MAVADGSTAPVTPGKSSQESVVTICLCALLAALCLLTMAPILIHPHWGMLSDPVQIIDTCTRLYSAGFDWNTWQRNIWVDFRPGFHLLDLILWAVTPNSPYGYYLLRWFCFACTVCFTFSNTFMLTQSRQVSFVSSSFWFLAYPTYEVIYTLDKGEVYLAFLFSGAVQCYLRGATTVRQPSMKDWKRGILLYLVGWIFCTTYAIFTKQTGLLMVGYSFITVVLAILNRFNNSVPTATRLSLALSIPIRRNGGLLWSALCFSLTLAELAFYRALFVHFGGLQFKYGETSFEPTFICAQLAVYCRAIPEFFALFLFATVIVLPHAWKSIQKRDKDSWLPLQSLALVFTTTGGIIALCAWKSKVAYIWYPLFAMLLPAVGYSMMVAFSRIRLAPFALLGLACTICLPWRIVDGETQYFMDATFNRMIAKLASLPRELGHDTNVIVKLKEQTSAELGEEIEAAVAALPISRVVRTAKCNNSISIYNIIRNASGDWSEDCKTLTEESARAADYKAIPGLNKLMFLRDTLPHWRVSNVAIGDILLMPYGNVPLSAVPYRGLLCFAKPPNALPESVPQLGLKFIFAIEKNFARVNGNQTKIGWMAFEITKTPPIALPLGDYGWFLNKGKIYFAPDDLKNRTLIMKTKASIVDSINIIDTKQLRTIQLPKSNGVIEIPLGTTGKLEVVSPQNVGAPVVFQVQQVDIR